MASFMLQLFLLGVVVVATSAAALSTSKKNQYPPSLMLSYNWPEPDSDITQYPHESSCHHYYLMLSEEDISVEKCPDNQMFDYFKHECTSEEHARCWSRHFGKIAHFLHRNFKKPFKCPFEWGKYPDVENCTMYYMCLNGQAKHKKCAPFEHFDKIQRKCVAEIYGVCADKSDVIEHGYKCPKSWGSFIFHKDCSKYYECLQKKPTVRSCEKEMLFDKKQRKCAPKDEVKCGSRYNPYEVPSSIDDSEGTSSPAQTPDLITQDTKSSEEKPMEKLAIVADVKAPVKEVPFSSSTNFESSSKIAVIDETSTERVASSSGDLITPDSSTTVEETDGTEDEFIKVSNATHTDQIPLSPSLTPEKVNGLVPKNESGQSGINVVNSQPEKLTSVATDKIKSI